MSLEETIGGLEKEIARLESKLAATDDYTVKAEISGQIQSKNETLNIFRQKLAPSKRSKPSEPPPLPAVPTDSSEADQRDDAQPKKEPASPRTTAGTGEVGGDEIPQDIAKKIEKLINADPIALRLHECQNRSKGDPRTCRTRWTPLHTMTEIKRSCEVLSNTKKLMDNLESISHAVRKLRESAYSFGDRRRQAIGEILSCLSATRKVFDGLIRFLKGLESSQDDHYLEDPLKRLDDILRLRTGEHSGKHSGKHSKPALCVSSDIADRFLNDLRTLANLAYERTGKQAEELAAEVVALGVGDSLARLIDDIEKFHDALKNVVDELSLTPEAPLFDKFPEEFSPTKFNPADLDKPFRKATSALAHLDRGKPHLRSWSPKEIGEDV